MLRVTSLSRSLFTDEAYSLALAQRGFGHMLALFGYEANGTLYSIALWPLVRIFGTGEALLRSPAVIAGTASVPALWWAARGLGATRAAALLAAALLAVNPMAVWYSQEARAYAFVVLATCLAFGALARAVAPGSGRRAWIGYVLAMAALAYCDLLAAPLVLPAQALLARRAGRDVWRRWLASLVALLLCCLPLLVAAVISRSRRDALYWLPKASRGLAELALQEFTGGFSDVTAVRWITLAAGRSWWGLRSGARAAPISPTRAPRSPIAACWGLVPCVLLFAVSVVKPLFWPRYVIMALPGLCLLAALAARRLWDSRGGIALAGTCLALVVLAGGVADARQISALQENWPPAAAWLRAERAPGQPTIVDNALVLPSLGYYDPAFRARDGAADRAGVARSPAAGRVRGLQGPHRLWHRPERTAECGDVRASRPPGGRNGLDDRLRGRRRAAERSPNGGGRRLGATALPGAGARKPGRMGPARERVCRPRAVAPPVAGRTRATVAIEAGARCPGTCQRRRCHDRRGGSAGASLTAGRAGISSPPRIAAGTSWVSHSASGPSPTCSSSAAIPGGRPA